MRVAEEEGFEPPVPFPAQRFSRPPPSTTRPLLRRRVDLNAVSDELARRGVGVLPAATLPKSSARATRVGSRVSASCGLRVRQGTWPPSPLPCLRSGPGSPREASVRRSVDGNPRQRESDARERPRSPRHPGTTRSTSRAGGAGRVSLLPLATRRRSNTSILRSKATKNLPRDPSLRSG